MLKQNYNDVNKI